MKKQMTATYNKNTYTKTPDGKYIYESRNIVVMTIADGYAMVRSKGFMPYVVSLKELSDIKVE